MFFFYRLFDMQSSNFHSEKIQSENYLIVHIKKSLEHAMGITNNNALRYS